MGKICDYCKRQIFDEIYYTIKSSSKYKSTKVDPEICQDCIEKIIKFVKEEIVGERK